jgi:LacI family transcriptional regulator
VFGGSSKVHDSTRQKVLASAQELGYVVNGLARAMQGRGTRTVAFVVRAMIGPTFASLAAGAEQVASANGNLLFMSTTHGDTEREAALIATLREQRVAAVLLVGSTESDADFGERVAGYAKDLADVDAPLILCGRPPVPEHPALVAVDYDHRVGVGLAVDELAKLGHRKIAYVGEPRGMTTAELRMDGYRSGLERNGLPFESAFIRVALNNEDDGARAVAELLATGPAVTAIVCMTDNIAVGAYRAVRAAGLRIPEDVSIVGFDDVPVVGDLTPGLTTVHPPFFEVGVRAGEIALGLAPSENVLLQPTLVHRGSTAPPLQT